MSATLAIDALNRRSLRQAMSAALAWWRTAPLPGWPSLIIALEAVTPEGDRDGFSARLLGIVVGGNSVKSRSNLEALEKHAADPRLTDFLITLIGAPPFDIAAGNPEVFIRAVVELLLRQPDPRVLTWRERRRRLSAGAPWLPTRAVEPGRGIATVTRIVSTAPASRPPKPKEDARVDAFAKALEPLQRAKSSAQKRANGCSPMS